MSIVEVLSGSLKEIFSVKLNTLWIFDPEEKAICVCRNPTDKPITPPRHSLTHKQTDKASAAFFSCLQKDKTRPSIVPLRLISSSLCYLWCWAGLRSARWLWTGGVSGQCLCVVSTLYQPLPVLASAAAAPPRFSARKPDWTVCPLQIWASSTFLFMWHTLCHA